MAQVRVKDLTKHFGNTIAVDEVNLEFPDGKLTVLVGPSGCGKTTLLRMLAGLEEPTDGEIFIGEREVGHIPAWDRNVAMVFQSYALYPHMSVFKNMAFPLEARGMSRREIKQQVEETAHILGLEDLLNRQPRQLSGGQMQRVAIGRAIVRQPDVFLMDEPLSNLDAKLRVNMRAELKRLQRDLGVTTVYVTHDQAEAMTLADQLVVMHNGRVLQVDYPEDVYNHPNEMFVAGFIGSPGMNFIYCQLSEDRSRLQAPCFVYHLPLQVADMLRDIPPGREVVFGIRPEDIKVEFYASPFAVEAGVYISETLGKETLLTLKCGDNLIKASVPASLHLDIGAGVWMTFVPGGIRIFDAESEKLVVNGSVWPAEPAGLPPSRAVV
jgi:multiple sugar transport system ATP-binding protein